VLIGLLERRAHRRPRSYKHAGASQAIRAQALRQSSNGINSNGTHTVFSNHIEIEQRAI